MRIRTPLASLAGALLLVACAVDAPAPNGPNGSPAPPAERADPMAVFARMVPGEWRMTALAGTSTFDTWHWGPGRHSMRVMTDGSGSSVVPEPWRELQVFYWHPGREQICMLGLSPFAHGVSEGTLRFDGPTADGVFDLYQTYGRRRLGLHWEFAGPDQYHDVLLEATSSGGFEPMNAWDHFRSIGPPAPRSPTYGAAPQFPESMKPLEALVGRTWEAAGTWASADAFRIRTTFEWIPYADGIYARTVALAQDGEPVHLLDAYLFHHTGTGALRCLALSRSGGVYEGDWSVLEDGALRFELQGYEGERVVPLLVRFDFEHDGSLRDRVWLVEGTDRTPLLDVRHEKVEQQD